MIRLPLFLATATLLLASSAHATVVAPGDMNVPIATGSLNGATLLASQSHPFSFVGSADVPGPGSSHNPYSFTGSFNEYVYRDPTGTLDFAYNFTVTTRTVSGPFYTIPIGGIIDSFVLYHSGITTDVLLNDDAGNSFYPTLATNSPSVFNSLIFKGYVPSYATCRQSPDSVIPDPSTLPPKTYFVRTDATQFDSRGYAEVVYTYGFSDTPVDYGDAFQPLLAAPVPEPSSLLTLPLAIAALLRSRRRFAR